ncbi:hypothetical protein ABMA28_010634 [Loxostege sticticalis]|uniref:Uncharacterized protein n=1 Tax=Loxostege sticticalis TaxID=481309 RepID=A0ABD0S8W2_LOXSC
MSREKSSIDFTMNMEDSKIDEEAQDHKKQDQKKDLFDGHSGKTIWVQMALFGNDADDVYVDTKTRNRFVRKVCMIVFLLLVITATFNWSVCFLCIICMYLQKKVFKYVYTRCLVTIVQALLSRTVFCSCLLLVPPDFKVICMSIMTAYATVKVKTTLVIFALAATTLLVIVLTLIAYSSWDFTKWWNYIVFASLAFFAVTSIIYIYMAVSGERMKTLQIVICIISTVLNSVIFVMDLQAIIGGKSVELSEDLYLYGAWELYTSIIFLFLKLLRLFVLFGGDD